MELSVAKGEGACQNSANCRKTQQKFLHPLSNDTRICKSRKGQGGNTASQHCFVIAKSVLDADDLAAICEGMFKWVCLLHKYGKRCFVLSNACIGIWLFLAALLSEDTEELIPSTGTHLTQPTYMNEPHASGGATEETNLWTPLSSSWSPFGCTCIDEHWTDHSMHTL